MAVIVPAVRVLMVAVIAFNIVVKKLDDVAFCAVRFVVLAVVAANKVVVPLVTTSLVTKRFVVVADVPKRLVKYRAEAVRPPVVEALPCTYSDATVVEERVEVAKVEVPVTERVPVA